MVLDIYVLLVQYQLINTTQSTYEQESCGVAQLVERRKRS